MVPLASLAIATLLLGSGAGGATKIGAKRGGRPRSDSRLLGELSTRHSSKGTGTPFGTAAQLFEGKCVCAGCPDPE